MISEAFRFVVLKSEQCTLCVFGGGGYFRNRSVWELKKITWGEFVKSDKKKPHTFWLELARTKELVVEKEQRSNSHSNIIVYLPCDIFLKFIMCLFVTRRRVNVYHTVTVCCNAWQRLGHDLSFLNQPFSTNRFYK